MRPPAILFVAAVLAVTLGSTANAMLLNGSFETGETISSGQSWADKWWSIQNVQPPTGDNAFVNNWSVDGGATIWYMHTDNSASGTSYGDPSDGVYFVALQVTGTDTRWIEQSFATAIGQNYYVAFDVSNRYAPSMDSADTFKVEVDNTGNDSAIWTRGQLTADGSNPTGFDQVGYLAKGLSFTATDATTTLRFTSVGNGDSSGSGFYLDNVTAVTPEPSTLAALFGMGVMGLVGRRWRKRKAA